MEKVSSKSNVPPNSRISPTGTLTDDELEEFNDDLKNQETFDDYASDSDNGKVDECTILSLEKRKESLQNGDYVVQVHVIEARNLKGRGWNAMSDPVVVVDVMNRKQSTNIKSNCMNAVWDEVLFFEFKDLDKQEINEGKCTISVYDANTIMRNVLIGSYEFDLATVYFNTYHEIYKQWVGLFDITDQNEGVQGYLRVSLVVLGPNDEQKTHQLRDQEDENESNLLSVLLPPEIEQTPYLLAISIYECKDLCTSDVGWLSDACDPFAIVEFGSIRIKSKVKKGINVDMLCQLHIPIMEPIMSSAIKISFYDWNATKRNDRIASLSFNYHQIKNTVHNTPKWYILYGAPLGYQRGHARRMNQGFIEGTSYRGQVLLSFNVTKQIKRPQKGLVEITLEYELKPKTAFYLLQCDLYEGSEIHKIKSLMNNQMYIEISIGRYTAQSKKVNVKDGRCEWFQVISSNNNDNNNNNNKTSNDGDDNEGVALLIHDDYKGNIGPIEMPCDSSQCPDIFIYLCCSSNNKHISYLRIPFDDIYEKQWKNPPKWYNLKEDKAVDALNENIFPGSLLLTLNAGRAEAMPPNGYLPESRPFITGTQMISNNNNNNQMEINSTDFKPLSSVGNLTVYIQQAQNLPPMDKSGSSDPYVQLRIYDKTGHLCSAKTSVVYESLNPKWYQSFTFCNIPIGETLSIKLLDADTLRSDDLMGCVEILLVTQSNRAPGTNFDVKNWFFVNKQFPDSKIQCRLKFEFLSIVECESLHEEIEASTFSNKLKRSVGLSSVKTTLPSCSGFGQATKKSMQLRIHLYSARDLTPTDANGLCDPYVVVRCCGQITKSKIMYQTIDPQWYQSLILNILLPQPLTVAPDIHIQVLDFDKFSKDDVVGRFIIRPCDISDHLYSKPTWFSLCDADGSTIPNGEILMSFQLIVVSHHVIPIVQSLVPKSSDKWLQIVTLGLRDLNSVFGVNKPYIKFNINDKTFRTKKSNKPSSVNPNFLQVLKIKLALPDDHIFAPSLRLTVKDSLFGGAIKRNIGNASISLQDLLQNPCKFKRDKLQKKELNDVEEDVQLIQEEEEKESMEHQAEEEQEEEVVISINEDDNSIETTNLIPEEEKKEEEKDNESSFDLEAEQKVNVTDEIPEYLVGRQIFDNELEDEIEMNPFLEIPIFTGQCNSTINKRRKIGYFKGLMEITDSNKSSELANFDKSLLQPKNLFIRLYILRGIRLTPKDSDGTCDPYLVVKFGKNYKVSTRNRYMKNTLNPAFYESFEIACKIPGACALNISVWDWDGIGDDLVGTTTIDVEDRWFSQSWRRLGGSTKQLKPLEMRTLHSNASSFAQGKLELWLEILTHTEMKCKPLLDISPPPPSPYELRVIIWECKDVTIKDEMTQMNDLFVTATLDGVNINCKQETDLHFRSQTGYGSFNWRMKYTVNLPCPQEPPRLRIQIWDKDYFSVNDSICEAYLSLLGLFKKALKNKDRTTMKYRRKEAFWINELKHSNFEGNQGRIKISIECMPSNIAQQLPAGYGRGEPNMNPYLPPPQGRAKFSLLSPLRSLRNLLGDRMVCKLCIGFVISAIISFLVLIGPTLVSVLTAKAFF